jgi:hypothetical protein
VVNLTDALLVLAPSAVPNVDWTVTDTLDGNGPQITFWNTGALGAQPTPVQIAAVTPPQVAAAKNGATHGNGVALFGASGHDSVVLRAIVLTLIDQINTVRGLLPVPLGAIPPGQAKAAINTKINSGAAD